MIKFEWQSYDDFETDFKCAKAVLETLMESMHAPCVGNEHEDTVFAAWRLLESAESWLESGRIRGKTSDWIDDPDDWDDLLKELEDEQCG